MTKKSFFLIVILANLFSGSYAFCENTPVGTVRKVIGSVSITRGHEQFEPSLEMNIFYKDIIRTGHGSQLVIKMIDGNTVNLPANLDVSMEEIVRQSLEKRSNRALRNFLALASKISKESDYQRISVASMGTRGVPDENSLSNAVEQIDMLLSGAVNQENKNELLVVKADLLVQLGDYKGAMNIYNTLPQSLLETEEIAGHIRMMETVMDKTIAISTFEGRNDDTSDMIREILTTDLSKSGQLKIVERSKINDILEEQKISLAELINSTSQQVKVGNLLSAEYLLTGSYHYMDDEVRLNARLVDVESGQIVESWYKGGIKEDLSFHTQQLAIVIHKQLTGKDIPDQNITSLGSESGIKPIPGVDIYLGLNRDEVLPEYKNGENMDIFIKVVGPERKEYYVTIIAVGAEGEINQLFPNGFNTDNLLQTNTVYELPAPSEKDEYSFVIYGEPGKNVLIGIVTEKPLYFTSPEKVMQEVFPALSGRPDNFLTRAVGIENSSGEKQWTVGKIEFMTAGE